ncbi:hypothetical protein G9A89_013196 [Geosiphon pyriformis]|nr:hypothetical protein G9A89_013196 [Geosiphon pyriformis]
MDKDPAENPAKSKKNWLVLPTLKPNDSRAVYKGTERSILKQPTPPKGDTKLSDDDGIDWVQVAKILKERLAFAYFKTQHGWQHYDLATCEKKFQEKLQSRNLRRATLPASFAPNNNEAITPDQYKNPQQSNHINNGAKYKGSKKHKKRMNNSDPTHPSKKAKHQFSLSTRNNEDQIDVTPSRRHSSTQHNGMPVLLNAVMSELSEITDKQRLQPLFYGAADPMISDYYSQNQDLTSSLDQGTSSPPSTPPHQQPLTPTDEHAAELLYFFASSPVAASPARTPASRFMDAQLGYTTPPHRMAIESSTPKSAFFLSEFINVTPTPKSPFSLSEYMNMSPLASKSTPGVTDLTNYSSTPGSNSLSKMTHPPLSDRKKSTPTIRLSFDEYVNNNQKPKKTPPSHPLFTDFLSLTSSASSSKSKSAFSQSAQ